MRACGLPMEWKICKAVASPGSIHGDYPLLKHHVSMAFSFLPTQERGECMPAALYVQVLRCKDANLCPLSLVAGQEMAMSSSGVPPRSSHHLSTCAAKLSAPS